MVVAVLADNEMRQRDRRPMVKSDSTTIPAPHPAHIPADVRGERDGGSPHPADAPASLCRFLVVKVQCLTFRPTHIRQDLGDGCQKDRSLGERNTDLIV